MKNEETAYSEKTQYEESQVNVQPEKENVENESAEKENSEKETAWGTMLLRIQCIPHLKVKVCVYLPQGSK